MFERLLAKIASALRKHKIPYMVAARSRDIEDIESILLKNPEYDRTFIREQLKEFDAALDTDLAHRFATIEEDCRPRG